MVPVMPEITDEFADEVSERYIELFEQITGSEFTRADISDVAGRIEKNCLDFLKKF